MCHPICSMQQIGSWPWWLQNSDLRPAPDQRKAERVLSPNGYGRVYVYFKTELTLLAFPETTSNCLGPSKL